MTIASVHQSPEPPRRVFLHLWAGCGTGSPGAGWSILPVDAVILAGLAWARIERGLLWQA
jgi:hypothetical protein